MNRPFTQNLFLINAVAVILTFAMTGCSKPERSPDTASNFPAATPAAASMPTQSGTPVQSIPATPNPLPPIDRRVVNDESSQETPVEELPSKAAPSAAATPIDGGIAIGSGGGSLDNPRIARDPSKIDYNRIYNGKEVDRRARILLKPEPTYTESGKQSETTGTVILNAVLRADGQITDIKPISTLPNGLTERAIEAARRLKFEPAQINGRPVSMYIQLQYNFNLY